MSKVIASVAAGIRALRLAWQPSPTRSRRHACLGRRRHACAHRNFACGPVVSCGFVIAQTATRRNHGNRQGQRWSGHSRRSSVAHGPAKAGATITDHRRKLFLQESCPRRVRSAFRVCQGFQRDRPQVTVEPIIAAARYHAPGRLARRNARRRDTRGAAYARASLLRPCAAALPCRIAGGRGRHRRVPAQALLSPGRYMSGPRVASTPRPTITSTKIRSAAWRRIRSRRSRSTSTRRRTPTSGDS